MRAFRSPIRELLMRMPIRTVIIVGTVASAMVRT